MTSIMIDLETMGNSSNASIIQIGAVYFDPKTAELGPKFKRNIDLQSCIDHGMEVNGDTVDWWLKRSDSARQSVAKIANGGSLGITEAMIEFRKFITDNGIPEKVWSHATFDFVIIQNAFKVTRVNTPFGYKSARDIRTLVDLAEFDPFKSVTREGTHHDALEDAEYQVKYVVEGLKLIGCKKEVRERLDKLVEERR